MVKKIQLKNGLKVLLVESHKSPVISAQMWVKTGSADEKKGEEGISHFIEHLLFKGTRKFKVGEIASMVEGSGGELNAYTSFDQTVFYITISKQFSHVALNALADMMGFPLFDASEINNEREVVVEEIKKGEDSLGRKASQLLFSTVYSKHPYGIPVIGYEKNVRKWSAKKIKDFYKARYNPSNMILVVTGDFDPTVMASKITDLFEEMPIYKLEKRKRPKDLAQKKERFAIEKSKFEQSISYLAWKVPTAEHKDIPALEVLSIVFGQGDSSRLVKALRIDKATVNSVGSGLFSPNDEGIFMISFGYNKENLVPALEGIKEQTIKLLTDKISSEEIRKAITNLESESFYSVETVDGLAREFGNAEFRFNDIHYHEKYLKKVRAVTEADLKRVAKKYLNPEKINVVVVSNDEEKATKSKVEKFVKEFKAEFKKAKTKKAKVTKVKTLLKTNYKIHSEKSDVEKLVLSSGAKLLLLRSEETHLVSARAAFLGGSRLENDQQGGATELLSRTWLGGTKNRNENQIYKEIEELAAGLSPVAGRNTVGMSLEVLKGFESQASDLFLDNLFNPLLPDEVSEREKTVQLEQIKSRHDNPTQVCIRQFEQTLFEGHPYARDPMGSEQSLKEIKGKDLKELYQKQISASNLTFVLAGHFDQKMWIDKLDQAIAGIGPKTEFKNSFSKPKTQEKHIYQKLQKEQSHFILGYQGLTLTDPDRYTLGVIQAILAGQGGRLFLELRDKNSLAYSVAPLKMEGIETGYFGAYIGCSPDKIEKAKEMMLIEFQKLIDERVGDKELERAQRYIVGKHDIDLQRTGALSAALLYDEVYGLDAKEALHIENKIMSISSADIQRVAERIFTQPYVTRLVGPRDFN